MHIFVSIYLTRITMKNPKSAGCCVFSLPLLWQTILRRKARGYIYIYIYIYPTILTMHHVLLAFVYYSSKTPFMRCQQSEPSSSHIRPWMPPVLAAAATASRFHS